MDTRNTNAQAFFSQMDNYVLMRKTYYISLLASNQIHFQFLFHI
jgi:hypothetical protein